MSNRFIERVSSITLPPLGMLAQFQRGASVAMVAAQAAVTSYVKATLAAGTPTQGPSYNVPLGAKSISTYVSFTAGAGQGAHQARVSVAWQTKPGGLSFVSAVVPAGAQPVLQPQQFDLPVAEAGASVGWVVSIPVPAGAAVMTLSVEQVAGTGASVEIDLVPALG